MRNRADFRKICFTSSIAITLLLSLAQPARAQNTRVYTVDRASNLLREINPNSGEPIRSVAITVPGGATVRGANGLATDPTTSKLYALLEFNPAGTGSQSRTLATIDPNTGVATVIGSALTRAYSDITFSTGGTLYAVTGDGSTSNPETLFSIDKATAVATLVAALGNGDDGEAIGFNSDNNLLYHMSGTNNSGLIPPQTMVLETINPASPTTPPVNIPFVTSIAISEATAMVYEGGGRFLWIDILNSGFPPTTSRLMTMTTGGVPTVRGSLTYTAMGLAIVRVFNLAVNIVNNGTATGTVASVPAGVTCGPAAATCTTPLVGGSRVTLTATPNVGTVFTGWSGACTGTGTCVVDMNSDKSVTATFSPVTRTLTVTRTGSGTVTSAPAGTPALDCGTTCVVTFPQGTSVTLTATAAAGNSFVLWGGACSGFSGCSVAMTEDRTVNATFGVNQTLTVNKVGNGTGTVTSDRAGISCGTSCAAPFGQGAVVVLTAVAAAGSNFASWSGGGCSGNSSTCSVTMTAAQTVLATFFAPDIAFGAAPAMQTASVVGQTSGSAEFVVTVNGTGGFSGSVALACSGGLPAGASCNTPTIALTPDNAGASTGTATVRVTVPRSAEFGVLMPRFTGPWLLGLTVFITLLTLGIVAYRHQPRFRPRIAIAGSGLAIVALIGACGGSSEPDVEVTDYVVTITATGTQGSQTIQKSQTVQLRVEER